MRGTMVKSEEARKYALDVATLARSKRIQPIDGDVVVYLEFYRPKQMGDLDNRIKPLLDSLQGVAFHDDKQVVEIHAVRRDDPKHPRVEVKIEAIAA
jgi:Holliday junction resolvase RusA-like endonuclease